MALLTFARARLEILVLNATSGMCKESEPWQELQAGAVQAIEKACDELVGGIPETQVVQLLRSIADAPFTEEQQARNAK